MARKSKTITRSITESTPAILACAGICFGMLMASPVYAISPTLPFVSLPGAQALSPSSVTVIQEVYVELESDPTIHVFLEDPRTNTLVIYQDITGRDMETIKFQQYYKGVEVVGGVAARRRTRKGKRVVNDLARFDLDVSPSFNVQRAYNIARSYVGDRQLEVRPQLEIFPAARGGNARLVYDFHFRPMNRDGSREVILDAHTGALIGDLSMNETIAPVEVFNAKDQGLSIDPVGQQTLQGCKVADLSNGQSETISAANCKAVLRNPEQVASNRCQIVVQGDPILVNPQNCQRGTQNDPSAVRAAENSAAVLRYFLTHHNWNSYDGKGSPVISVVHAGEHYLNAHWSEDQNIMVYGDGDPSKGLGDFTLALDVAGHEMTHGVTAHTAQLLAMGESGALNEANSDFFGIMVAGGQDWAIGRKLFVNSPNPKGVRNLANPGSLTFPMPTASGRVVPTPFPSNIREMIRTDGPCDDTNDNCWVHENATIPGHASYLVTQAIGQAKAEHLYFTALTQAWTAKDTIQTALESVKHVCDEIYDVDTCARVRQALAQVGI